MVATVSGHPAAESYSDPRLASGTVPGTKGIRLTTMKAALPLFLDVARRANRKVAPLSARDTWSIGIRPPRAGSHSQTSDHAGWACDFWAAGIGAHTWPPRMNAKQARVMRRIVHSYKTRDGRRVFGWGAHESLGGDYTQTVNNDPMHVFVRPGITANDLAEVQRRMSIRDNGTRERSIATPVATAKVTRRSACSASPATAPPAPGTGSAARPCTSWTAASSAGPCGCNCGTGSGCGPSAPTGSNPRGVCTGSYATHAPRSLTFGSVGEGHSSRCTLT